MIKTKYPDNVISAIFGMLSDEYVFMFDEQKLIERIDEIMQEKFTEQDRIIFYGRYREKLSFAKISAMCNKSPSVVTREYRHILRQLRHPRNSKRFKEFVDVGKVMPDGGIVKEEA